MEAKHTPLLGIIVLLAGLLLAVGSPQATDYYLDDLTDTCIVFQPDSGEGNNAVACFYVTYYDTVTGKPISYFHDPEPITSLTKVLGSDDIQHRSVMDSQGNIHFVWMNDRVDYIGEILYSKVSSAGEVLVEPIQISDEELPGEQANSGYPSLALDSDENVHVVWKYLVLRF